VPKFKVEGPAETAENRFVRLYREIVRRNAETVAKWQVYGFMNGVLNTDNTSICGLSVDFGPFAFMDTFSHSYTPNHDDRDLRYSYGNQPTAIWWNLVRLGEALGELMGIGAKVDDKDFVENGLPDESETEKDVAKRVENIIMQVGEEFDVARRAEKIINQVGREFKAVFLAEYKRLMAARLGLKTCKDGDFKELYTGLLDTMEALSLDYNHFFRRLGGFKLGAIATEGARKDAAAVFLPRRDDTAEVPAGDGDDDAARERIAAWMDKWRRRALEDWGEDNEHERLEAMRLVNPNFVPRGWILSGIIDAVEEREDVDMLRRAMRMATHPFEDAWDGQKLEGDEETWKGDGREEREWTGNVPARMRSMQCYCSS
jgi:uncharacterized protein YdiU (UPF0061 family)